MGPGSGAVQCHFKVYPHLAKCEGNPVVVRLYMRRVGKQRATYRIDEDAVLRQSAIVHV